MLTLNNMSNKEYRYFTIDTDQLLKYLEENGDIEKLGIGDRYDDKFSGLNNEYWNGDNSYNWELLIEESEDLTNIYSLSNDLEIRESDRIVIISKHIGNDIRAGYEDDIIYLKQNDGPLYYLIEATCDYSRDINNNINFIKEDE